MKRLSAVIFDLDDTLYLERDFARSGYLACAEWLGSAEFATACWRRLNDGQRLKIFDDSLAELGLTTSVATVASLVELYRNHNPDITLCADAAAFLKTTQYNIGVITDGFADTQLRKARCLGLDKVADPILCTGTWGKEFWKPHPRAFEHMERIFGSGLAYVADNPSKDFVTPRSRGWMTIQILRPDRLHHVQAPDQLHEAHTAIASLGELDIILNGSGALSLVNAKLPMVGDRQ